MTLFPENISRLSCTTGEGFFVPSRTYNTVLRLRDRTSIQYGRKTHARSDSAVRLHTLCANSWLAHNGADIRIRGVVALLPHAPLRPDA